jgi:tripartite-type tricarboxylate transporter receptor subunit TctC
MQPMSRRSRNVPKALLLSAALAAALAAAAPAWAQDYPHRPITLIVPFPPGGSTTIVGRIVADKMSEALGQQIIVDNRAGAGGTVGSKAAARSTPDGYTIQLGYTGTLAIGPSLYTNVGYDPRRDFEPIGRIGTAPNTLVVHPSFQVRSVAERRSRAPSRCRRARRNMAPTSIARRRNGPRWSRRRAPGRSSRQAAMGARPYRIATIALLAALAGAALPADAQQYPARPITLVVPFPPGGSATIIARAIADKLSDALGQQIVIDNRGGAGGSIAARQVARSAPDGYTILLAFTGTLAVSPTIFPSVGYDPRKDFAGIGLIGMAPSVFAVHPSVPAQSVADLIRIAKASPGNIQFGSPGIGTTNHLAGELLASMADIKISHIPYKGTGPAVTDLLGGHISMMFVPIPAAHGNVSAGLLRALGVTSLTRSRLLPDVPTVAESGLPGFEVVQRSTLLAPAGTPRPIIERLNKELNAVLATDEVRRRLALEGGEPIPGAPEEYAADIDREEARWSKLVTALGLKGE